MIAPLSPHAPPRSLTTHAGSCTVYCNGATMRAYCRDEITVVHITGEVDATNIDRFFEYAHRFASDAPGLILNLSEVDFLCARGLFVLRAVDSLCRAERRAWAIVTSPAVKRLLQVGDPKATLPTASSEREALTTIDADRRTDLAAS
ncbi:STAS domain-containing protein [Mycobacterium intermedium]|nr:STAS domain-containing protein [Mycobacterium intermedium]MCV6967846.1 STAS domain-containing protein [Mycobacterium intermedium]